MKFLLLTTGGTIASIASDKGYIPTQNIDNLLNICPLLRECSEDIDIVNLFAKDSSNINPLDWQVIAKSIRTHASKFDAVILLHGTDTMAWTSTALSYLLYDIQQPIVMTGAILPADQPNSDVADNIFSAFQFARQLVLHKRKGVAVAFAESLFHGARITKINSHEKNAFASIDYPLLDSVVRRG